MPRRSGPVHVVTTKRTYKGRVYRTHLLRRSYRVGRQVRNETVGNLSHLPEGIIDLIRQALAGRKLVCPEEHLTVTASRAHGHVQAVLTAMRALGLDSLLASRPSPERSRVLALVAARILAPQSKLATTRWWHTTTLAEVFGVSDADEDDLYHAMDWLGKRQGRIEKKLAQRHLTEGGLVLCDLTSGSFEGTHCPLATFGHNRDRKKGTLQVNYGLLTDRRGCPVSVTVFSGNISDPKTLLPQVTKIQQRFEVRRMVMVGDRGMICQKQIDVLRDKPGLQWIAALRSEGIRKLLEAGAIQMGLFDERNLFELSHPDFPGERLVACRNAELAWRRAEKRKALLEATAKELVKVRRMVQRKRLRGKDQIGVRIGKGINKYKVAKHFDLTIEASRFTFRVHRDRVAAEAALDGLYVIRTNVPKGRLTAEDAVRNYKSLSNVERAFRSFKTLDLHVRPIRHGSEKRVRSHIFLCMLASYVQWHMLEAWRPLLFADEGQEAKRTRDPVAPARRCEPALQKVTTHALADGTPAHSFRTLLADLTTVVRNTCHPRDPQGREASFDLTTALTAKQTEAMERLRKIAVQTETKRAMGRKTRPQKEIALGNPRTSA